jgi:hypothetical protein
MDRAPSGRRASVHEDWRSWLAGRKDEFFRYCSKDLESSYVMLSVALNESIELFKCGRLSKACQSVAVTPDLCERLATSLFAVLHQMGEHARHYGIVPNAAPLDAANFRGSRGQRAARLNNLLCHVLFTQRSQFLYKLGLLEEMVLELQREFSSASEKLSTDNAYQPMPLWESLDATHFDLNTCLRETIVLLKSFMVTLPDDQIHAFESSVRALRRRGIAAPTSRGFRPFGTGRATQVAGK